MTGPRKVTTTTRLDVHSWLDPLAAFLTEQLGTPVTLTNAASPKGSGMSGLSLLFTAHFERDGQPMSQRLVTRGMPHEDDLPVFPSYDLTREAAVMTAAREGTNLPVPEVLAIEPTGAIIGQPFLILAAMPGEAPQDNPSYVFDSWLSNATPAQQQHLEQRTIEALAQIHQAPAPDLLRPTDGRSGLRAHLDESRDYYEWTASDGVRIPLLDEAFAWLEANFPTEESDPVLLWGDSRIGNMLYVDFEPTAVLDWEYARFGPPETDVAWMLQFHWMFHEQAEFYGKPGMPDFHRLDRCCELYSTASGRELRDMEFHLIYAAVRTGIIMSRIARRSILLGDREPFTHPDEIVLNARVLRDMLDGRFSYR